MEQLRKYGSGVALAAIGAVILFAHAAQGWSSPTSVALIGLLVVLPLAIGSAVLLNWEQIFDRGEMKILWGNLVVGAVLILPVSFAWSLPGTRSAAIGFAESGLLDVDFMEAMRDDNSAVRNRACTSYLNGEEPPPKFRRALAEKPKFAVECLKRGQDTQWAQSTASNLLASWNDQLIRSSEGASNKCSRAKAMSKLPLSGDLKSTSLLRCTLEAETDAARKCCAKVASDNWGSCQGLFSSVNASLLKRNGLAGLLVGASFGAKKAKSRLGAAVDQLDLQCPAVREAGAKMLCEVTGTKSASARDRGYIRWLMDEHTACLEGKEREVEVRPWRFCDELVAAIRRDDVLDGEKVCRAHKEAAAEAVATEERIQDAGGNEELAAIADNVDKSEGAGAASGPRELVRRMGQQGNKGTRCHSGSQMGALLQKAMGGGKGSASLGSVLNDAPDSERAAEMQEKFDEGLSHPATQKHLEDMDDFSMEDAKESMDEFEASDEVMGKIGEALAKQGENSEKTDKILNCLKGDPEDCEIPTTGSDQPCLSVGGGGGGADFNPFGGGGDDMAEKVNRSFRGAGADGFGR